MVSQYHFYILVDYLLENVHILLDKASQLHIRALTQRLHNLIMWITHWLNYGQKLPDIGADHPNGARKWGMQRQLQLRLVKLIHPDIVFSEHIVADNSYRMAKMGPYFRYIRTKSVPPISMERVVVNDYKMWLLLVLLLFNGNGGDEVLVR